MVTNKALEFASNDVYVSMFIHGLDIQFDIFFAFVQGQLQIERKLVKGTFFDLVKDTLTTNKSKLVIGFIDNSRCISFVFEFKL